MELVQKLNIINAIKFMDNLIDKLKEEKFAFSLTISNLKEEDSHKFQIFLEGVNIQITINIESAVLTIKSDTMDINNLNLDSSSLKTMHEIVVTTIILIRKTLESKQDFFKITAY